MVYNVWLKLGNLEEDGKKCDGLNYRAKCVGQTPETGSVRPSDGDPAKYTRMGVSVLAKKRRRKL